VVASLVSVALAFTGIGTAATVVARHRRKRRTVLDGLAADNRSLTRDSEVSIAAGTDGTLREAFARARLAAVPGFLDTSAWDRLRTEALAHLHRVERSYIPTHKKGGAICYENILRHLPGCAAFYNSRNVRDWLGRVIGSSVLPTPLGDQSSLSLLCYHEAGDHIGWHYDHNFYAGRHFTALLSLVNRSATGELSSSRLMRQTPTGEEGVDTSENTLVVFEGARVRHRVTPTIAGDLRIMLSTTFCTDPRISRMKELARRCKDTAFFGLRTLWD